MTSVESILSSIFYAVPAFMCVNPQMASGPVTHSIAWSAWEESSAGLAQETDLVRAPTAVCETLYRGINKTREPWQHCHYGICDAAVLLIDCT